MLKQLTVNFKLHKRAALGLLICILGGFLVGVTIVCSILRWGGSENAWGTLGTIFGSLAALAYLVFRFYVYPQEFMFALSLGRTRKEFMLAWALELAIWTAASYILLMLLSCVESGLYRWWFPQALGEFSMLSILADWRAALLLIPFVVIFQMFRGSLYSRLGGKFGLVLILRAFLLGLIIRTVSRQMYAAGVESLEAGVQWLMGTPPLVWVGILCAILAVMGAVTVGIGMRQTVRT